jgi:hypothetical protein
MIYSMVLHQDLSQFEQVGWPGFGDDCCYLMTALISGDAGQYNSQFHSGKLPFLGNDVPLTTLQRYVEGRFAFVPPKILREHSPIPLQIPKYTVIDKEKKKRLKGRLGWETIDHSHWMSEANKNATESTEVLGMPRSEDN